MKEKTFNDWAMDELRLARKAAEEIETAEGATGIEVGISKHRMDIVGLAEEIFHLINDRDGLASYAALKMVEKLLDRDPLTAVTDESGQWQLLYPTEGKNRISFQHVRNYGLFKRYNKDGTMWITDVDRVYYANVREDETDFSYHNSHLTRLIDEIYAPITFPYTSEKIRVKVNRLDGTEIREDLPTIAEVISYSVNGGPFKKIGRFYRYNKQTNLWDEISPFVYYNHKNVIENTKKIYEEYDAAKKECPCRGEN